MEWAFQPIRQPSSPKRLGVAEDDLLIEPDPVLFAADEKTTSSRFPYVLRQNQLQMRASEFDSCSCMAAAASTPADVVIAETRLQIERANQILELFAGRYAALQRPMPVP